MHFIVIFTYQGIQLKILCLIEEKMKDIFKKYSIKINKNLNSLLFIYDGIKVENFESTFIELAKKLDKERKEMSILVENIDEEKELKWLKCPECGKMLIDLDIFENMIENQKERRTQSRSSSATMCGSARTRP